MKTYGNLYPRVCAFENLYLATMKAARGKRRWPNVANFLVGLEGELVQLCAELEEQTYEPGHYRTFMIHEPKDRMISAAPFRDRVVHHALCNVIGPLFERRMVYDCWANRVGKGSHRALDRFQGFCRQFRYVLKCDIAKHFPSIDHEILKAKVRRVVRCKPTLWLIDKIIDGSNAQEPVVQRFPADNLFTPLERRRGLPIGNLTSQFFANFHLDALDHFAKETLQVPGYVRYVDDFALFGDSKRELWEWRDKIERFLVTDRLKLHPTKTRVFRTSDGLDFLGFRVWPHRRRLKKENLNRMKRRLRLLQMLRAAGRIGLPEVRQRIRSWLAHAAHGDTYGVAGALLREFTF